MVAVPNGLNCFGLACKIIRLSNGGIGSTHLPAQEK
jgi:hypothetical protein